MNLLSWFSNRIFMKIFGKLVCLLFSQSIWYQFSVDCHYGYFNQIISVCSTVSSNIWNFSIRIVSQKTSDQLDQTPFFAFFCTFCVCHVCISNFWSKIYIWIWAIIFCIECSNAIVIYSIFVWQLQNTLEFIGNCEGFIKKSK